MAGSIFTTTMRTVETLLSVFLLPRGPASLTYTLPFPFTRDLSGNGSPLSKKAVIQIQNLLRFPPPPPMNGNPESMISTTGLARGSRSLRSCKRFKKASKKMPSSIKLFMTSPLMKSTYPNTYHDNDFANPSAFSIIPLQSKQLTPFLEQFIDANIFRRAYLLIDDLRLQQTRLAMMQIAIGVSQGT